MENILFSKFSDTEKNEKSTSKTEIYGIIKDMNNNVDENKTSFIIQ